jgi:hypothetical protein
MALPTIQVTAGFASGNADISAYLRNSGFTINRGSNTIPTTGFIANAGTFSCTLDNRDRRFDPNYTAGPYGTDVVPGCPLLVQATYGINQYSIFDGRVDAWPQQYPSSHADQIVAVTATDITNLFSDAQLTLTRGVESSGARIDAVTTAVGFFGSTAISTGRATVNPLNKSTVSAWSEMTDVTMAEWGDLYISATGYLTFRDRDLILSETRSNTSQGTFGDQGSELPYTEVTMTEPGDLPIINDVTITYNDTGSFVNVQDATSQSKPWGRKSLNVNLPINDRYAAQAYAQWILYRFAYPVTTFASMTLAPNRTDVNMWDQVLYRELGDLITVNFTPKGPGSRISKKCFIRGISHSYASGGDWKTTYSLEDATWTTNVARWDVNHWDDGSVYGL